MINEVDSFIEINPMTQFINENILINLNERKIVSVQIFNPAMDKKFTDLLLRFKKIYNIGLSGMILEIVTHPTESSLSTKTISHKLIYFNLSDLKSDYDKIRNIMMKRE